MRRQLGSGETTLPTPRYNKGEFMSTVFEEGIHYGIPEADYHAIDAASSSKLGALRRSPAHMRAERLEPRETKAFQEGSLIHKAVLEPDLFLSAGYVRAPDGDKRTKEVKANWNVLIVRHGEDKVLDPRTYDMCHAIAMNVSTHKVASQMLLHAQCEVTLMWRDPETGLECKGRVDALPTTGSWERSIIDVKSTKDGSPAGFPNHYFRYGYFRQMAFYLQGLEVLGLWKPEAHIIAVEKFPPYAVAIYRCDEGSLDAGHQENQVLLKTYAECLSSDYYPGYPELPVDLSIPSWAYAQVDDYVTENTNDHV